NDRPQGKIGGKIAAMQSNIHRVFLPMVPRRRLELPRPCGHRYLKPARLPIPPPGHREADCRQPAPKVNEQLGTGLPPNPIRSEPEAMAPMNSRPLDWGRAIKGGTHIWS